MKDTGLKKEELLRLLGSMEQVAGVREIEYRDGRASGLRCALVHNGLMEYALMLDKCLDPAWLKYEGMNFGILTKPGLQGKKSLRYGRRRSRALHYGRRHVYMRS